MGNFDGIRVEVGESITPLGREVSPSLYTSDFAEFGPL